MKRKRLIAIMLSITCAILSGCGSEVSQKEYEEVKKELEEAKDLNREQADEIMKMAGNTYNEEAEAVFPSTVADTAASDTGCEVSYGVIKDSGYQYNIVKEGKIDSAVIQTLYDDIQLLGAVVQSLMEDGSAQSEPGYYNAFKILDENGQEVFELTVLPGKGMESASISVGSKYFELVASTLLQ